MNAPLRTCLLVVAIASSVTLSAQNRSAENVAALERLIAEGMFSEVPVVGAPFSATATVTWHPSDGSPARATTARYARDAEGRTRVEQVFTDRRTGTPIHRTFISPTPAGTEVVLIEQNGSPYAVPRGMARRAVGGWATLNLPLSVECTGLAPIPEVWHAVAYSAADIADEPLGERTVAGLTVVGSRFSTHSPTETFGGASGLEIRGERWLSPALRALVYARIEDAQSGVVEFQLTGIERTPPPPSQFAVPEGAAPWPASRPHAAAVTRLSLQHLAAVKDGPCAGMR